MEELLAESNLELETLHKEVDKKETEINELKEQISYIGRTIGGKGVKLPRQHQA